MSGWLIALVVLVAVYGAGVLALAVAGRRGDAAAIARLVPDCAVVLRRLIADGVVPRRQRLLLLALLAYLAFPLDLVPDFIPVAGHLDDAILVALALRSVVRAAGAAAVAARWPGPQGTLALVLRAAGVGGAARIGR